MMQNNDVYEVYAIKYAQYKRKASMNFTNPTAMHDSYMPIDFFIWLIRSHEVTIVVGTGFNAATAKKRGRKLVRCPTEGLNLMNINAKSISDVFITHLHYDHAENFDLFPEVCFHLQEKEIAFATGQNMLHKPFRSPMGVDNIAEIVRKVFADKVIFHDGFSKIKAGIELHHIGGHTAGLQCVRVMTKRGWLVLASDAGHPYANFERKNPYPIIFKEDEMLNGYQTLKELAFSPNHIIPEHDPLVMERNPLPSQQLKGILARLDEEVLYA